ncbi:adhesion G-protein coupled receptor V1 isoform X2 [Hyla sarda]|uniref:adhesion G-protein coupled receptor V1 isoform X2 n=1 Tax=Hyla sarda TaxID=327740 RepID=UPI0024C3C982|nr:adhesion G-protein coupled receptor V1 isoform X2 [Hyla sarda]
MGREFHLYFQRGTGMPSVPSIALIFLALLVTAISGETQVQFAGQTEFFVNETTTTVIRLMIERTGAPVNITAIVLLQEENTGDFIATATAAFIPDWERNRTVYISVCDDDLPEADETFHFLLTLQNPPLNTKLGPQKVATVTILSNDNAFGIISINMSSSITVNEPQGRNQSLPVILLREKGTYGSVTVTVEIDGGPNPADEDLIPAKANITFFSGRSIFIYNLTVLDDQIPENDENFTLRLTDVYGGAEINITKSTLQINIKKNDSPVRFSQNSYMVPETEDVIIIPVIRGKTYTDIVVGSDDSEVFIKYRIITGNSTSSAQLIKDFIDLQPNNTIRFPPKVQEIALQFKIIDDSIPEIAESFQIVLLEESLQGDAVLQYPSTVYITIEPNDKPYGVLSINSAILAQIVIINEDEVLRYDGITIVRNGGTHGNVSVRWVIKRNSSDTSPVTTDIHPDSGVLQFSQGQMMATVPLTIVSDDVPEEAEAYLLQISRAEGGAELGSPTELLFYMQDSDDVYGFIQFHAIEEQKIESSPEGRCLTLSFVRQGGTKGDVKLVYNALYIPAGPVDPIRAKEGVLNVSSRNSVIFEESRATITVKLSIRNDAFLQNGAHFLVQLEFTELLRPSPIVPPLSPRLGALQNVSLKVTPDIANGEIGFISNLPIIVSEPENVSYNVVSVALQRDGTGNDAVVYWSMKPYGLNKNSITLDDLSPFNGSVTFLSGQSNTEINITIKADDVPEVNETVIISLDRVSVENQVLKSGFTSCELTILENDDPGGVFEFSPSYRGPYRVKEGDSVELRIARSKGLLVKQFLHYTIEPKDSNEFYGNTGILEFNTGEKEIVITLLTRMDGIPELDEMCSVVLSSHGEFPTTLGKAIRVNITILKNDDPHGVIEIISPGIVKNINESKGTDIHYAAFEVVRRQGSFGSINVTWTVSPSSTLDVYPEHGILEFKDGETMKTITISSIPDEIPEEKEVFTISIFNPTGGAKMGNVTTATLEIDRNDDAVFFAEPMVLFVEEGEVANLTIMRNGSADFVSSVTYATVSGTAIAEEKDFIAVSGDILIFEIGQRMLNISVKISEDDVPETDEYFYVWLYNCTGDTVVSGNGNATIIIKANDDPNGIFYLEPIDKTVEEGGSNEFKVLRDRGHFGSVSLYWQIMQNGSVLKPGQEFAVTSGILWFNDQDTFKYITLHAVSDQIPEFNEFYILKLVNISGGFPGPGGQLAEKNLNVTMMIPFNDDPFGVFVIGAETQNQEVAEDVLSIDDFRYVTNISIWRRQGTFGDVRIGWEIYSTAFKTVLPPMVDLLLIASFPSSVQLQPHMRRHHSGTDALFFSGDEGAFGVIESQYYYSLNTTLTNFTFSAWTIPNTNTNGFIMSKDNDNGTMYYGVKVETNDSYIMVLLYYVTFGSNTTFVAKAGISKFMEQSAWTHILITLDDGFIEFYIDGNLVPGGVKSLKGEAIHNGPGTLHVGAGVNGGSRYTGFLQDLRIYKQRLSQADITELHATPAKSDLHPIAGYLEYRQGEMHKSFVVSARDDNDEEGEELFMLKLVSVHGGARIPEGNTTAIIKILKSDNANGLFGFTGPCIPQSSEEGSTISCVVERTRGALDTVYLFYSITQTDSGGTDNQGVDFTMSSGNITFIPSQRSKVLNLDVLDDDIPELMEHFRVTLTHAISADGKPGSTPTSGASIDPNKKSEDITINASDHPYGLLQFSVDPPPRPGDNMTTPAKSVPIVKCKEEIGQLKLLVVRAQGLLGDVRVEYRTSPMTAFSPQDYQETADFLEFQPGERYKYISVNITDNAVPELAKSFKVELWNADANVAELFRDEAFASGDGEMEMFLPAVHQRASLGIASHIIVIIEDSDDAHGVFEFRRDSLFMKTTEPESGYSAVSFQVLRHGGALSLVYVFWKIESDPFGDLAFTSGNVTFQIGQMDANITIVVYPDDVPELDEDFSIVITNVSFGRLGAFTNASLTIFANDDPYGLFLFSELNQPIKVEEKNQNVSLTIKRMSGLMGSVMVTYQTIKDSETFSFIPPNIARATQWKDYWPIYGSVLFTSNISEVKIFLPILDDNEPERSESLFVELFNVTLVEKVQSNPVLNSPRLGSRTDTIAHVIINASDDAFGVLQLSTTFVRIAENYVGPIINVTRTGGMFADVSVKFKAVPISATASEDYSVASSDVVLLEGETSKAVPIYIINDINPEVEESFRVLLLNQTTGGALVGDITEAIIVIEASDDPYGSFVFQVTSVSVDEPDFSTTHVNLPVIRNAGTLGNVVVQWVATINGRIASDDLRVATGNISFAAGQTVRTLLLEIMPDNVPEIEEVILIQLIGASNGGTIGQEGVAKIIIPPNDNPYGTISFYKTVYKIQEPLEKSYFANITVRRSGGRFGHLQILYSTTEMDVISLAAEEGQDMLSYYESPFQGIPFVPSGTTVNVSLARNPLQACAIACLKNQVCSSFSYNNVTGSLQCFWITALSYQLANSTQFWTYKKNSTSVSVLFSSQATAGSDYETVTGQWFTIQEGEEFANITVPILTDSFPELDERFVVSLLQVRLLNISASLMNQPTIGHPNTSVVVIMMNGDAFGVFVIYNRSPNATDGGHYVEVQEQPHTIVQLVIERQEGSLGQVVVEWGIVGGTASRNYDFIADGELLVFAEGETSKIVTIMILDDTDPEENENIIVGLTFTEGGSRILPSSNAVTIVILANDNVAGRIGFQTASRSVIGREGENLTFNVLRTPPGRGNVTVHWKIVGRYIEMNFENSTGFIFFSDGSLNTSFTVHLLDDQIPEEREEYQIVLHNVITEGMTGPGAAVLDEQGYEAVLTVEASDEPHGLLNFAPSSRIILTQEEANKTIQLFINREYGSLGDINITYTTFGTHPLNGTSMSPAEPGLDYIGTSGSLMILDGRTTAAINVTILEDDIPELQEYILVTLVSVELTVKFVTSSPPRLDAEGLSAQIIIDANDGVQGVIEWQRTSFEVNETQGILTLVAYRNKGTFGNVSLFFYAQNIGAQLGMDYNVTSMILTFADGEKYKFIDVIINDDDIPEGDEKFQLILANPSHGLELGQNTTATVTILANDDGYGVISFNNTEHFFLREPTALYLTESVALLCIIREPPQGIFGTVTIQYFITGENGSDASGDLTPVEGYVILEEGVRFKTLEISAVLDEEPEMDEHFTVTLFNPTGGARLGTKIHTEITVLQNQAPQGLFSIFPTNNRTSSVTVEENNATVYLKVSRSNGLNMSVSVEWETVSGSAFGIKGPNNVLSVLQSFPNESSSTWCFFSHDDNQYAVLLKTYSATNSTCTLYEWRGVFVAVQDFVIENPMRCVVFTANDAQVVVITSGVGNLPSYNKVYTFTRKNGLLLGQTLQVLGTTSLKHFSLGSQENYLIVGSNASNSQVFKWKNGLFVPHQSLPSYGVTGITVFTRGGSVYMVMSIGGYDQNSLMFLWSNNQFGNLQDVPITGTMGVESLALGGDIYIVFIQAETDFIHIFLWESGQKPVKTLQIIPFKAAHMIHTFMPSSGLAHLLIAGENVSEMYRLDSEQGQFSSLLLAPPSKQLISSTVLSLNVSKTIIALAGDLNTQIFELTSVSNQSDFIPSSGELKFEPGQSEAIFAVNILDDSIPEEDETFKVRLKNPKAGAEIGAHSSVTIIIPTNDYAHGVIAFAQNSLMKQAEEMEQDNLISFSIERLYGTYGRVVVEWFANGSVADIFPASGMVTFSEGQALTTITITVVADSIAELAETVMVVLTKVSTINIRDPHRGAILDPQRSTAMLTILPNDSPHGVVGWHINSYSVKVDEPIGSPMNITLQITREQGFVGDIAIYLQSTPNFSLPLLNRAKEREDYFLKDKVIILRENSAFGLVNITILPDDIPELNEGFLLNITDVQFVNFSTSSGTPLVKRPGVEICEVTILENDEPRGIFQFNVTKGENGAVIGYEVPPPQNVLRLPVVRQAGNVGLVTVYWEALLVTASHEDFTPWLGNLTFSDGQSVGVIEIFILDDTIIEFLETFNVSLKQVTNGATLGGETTITVIIPPNDSPLGLFGFEKKVVRISEPQRSGDPAAEVSLTVVRSQGGHGVVKIIWIVEDAAQYDLSPLNGTLIFNESDTKKTFTIQAIQDGLLEGEETFTVQLVSAEYSVISPVDGAATVIILGDVGASGIVGIAPTSFHVLIGEPSANYNGTAHVSLIRGPGIFGDVTVYWNITPANPHEFLETSGMLTLRDRQSAAIVIIQALDDSVPEEKSYYQFHLSKISEGGIINESARFANITMVSSDLPYGKFQFSQTLLQISEDVRWVNVTISRSGGTFGDVELQYQTNSGSALKDLDYTDSKGKLVFRPNETKKSVSIEIKNDQLPEGPEDFFIIITEVALLGSGYDHAVRENGLRIDEPPSIGNNSVIRIIILINDNAEGVIEFDPLFVSLQVEEDVGTLLIPVLRIHGTYGYVTADFLSRGISASPNGVDYTISNTSVTFHHGQNRSFINVWITDDEESEFAEQFEIRLVGASGGAILGQNIVSVITIAKSDSPNGAVRFLNQSGITIPNPNVTTAISLMLERIRGHTGEAQIMWHILGPNSKAILTSGNEDFGEPLNGSFHYKDGEDGVRIITLTILPHGEIEVQKKFIIVLSVANGTTEIDPKAGNVTLTIQKFGDPNGIVQFAAESLLKKNYTEPENTEGPLNIALSIKRIQGTLGNLTVYWQLTSASDILGDFTMTSGWVVIPDGQNVAQIILQLLPDDVPELEETYMVQLTSVDGGADLDESKGVVWLTVLANDDPYGVFLLDPASQSIFVNSDMGRYVQVNVTRLAGTFGNVTVQYQISFGKSERDNLTGTIEGNVLVRDGASYGVSTVPISNQIFLSPGFNFTLELTNVTLMGISAFGKPHIHKGQNPTPVKVPTEAANSEIGFESVAFRLTNITSGMGHAVIYRAGSYGAVTINWRTGYPTGLMPKNIRLGKLMPESGVVDFKHGEDRKTIPLYLEANTSGPEGFALQLTGMRSSVPSGARLKQGFTFAEIEPMGVFQFSPNSTYIVVQEDNHTVSLHVQRLYGFHGNKTKVTFQTISGSAKPKEDYVPIDNGEVIFEHYQTSSIVKVTIINDKIYETDELFYINLTSVESIDAFHESPRLHLDFSLSTIQILANDFMSGVLSIGPAITYIDEDSNHSALNLVTIHVRRTHGSSGIVQVMLTTFGARKAQIGLQGLPFEQSHGSKNISWATEDLDFEAQAMLITLLDGQNEAEVSLRIIDDEEPEGMEMFYVFLTDPKGGAQIMEGKDESGYSSFSAIVIQGNDIQNGILGFSMESLDGLVLDEDSEDRTTQLKVSRQANRAFEDVKIYWRATFNRTLVELSRDNVSLVNELQAVSGYTICTAGQTQCYITVEVKDDKVPEFETYFFIELYDVSAGALINGSTRFAKIIIIESDSPRGLIFFAVGSRVAVTHKKTTLISLQISRQPNSFQSISFAYIIMELKRPEVIGHTVVYPAVTGQDFVGSEGKLTFEPGQKNIVLDISLTPGTASLNPYPKLFQVLLVDPTGGAKIDKLYGTANITILSDSSSQFTWGLLDQLHQPFDEVILNRVLQTLNNKAGAEFTQEQLGATMSILDKVTREGEKQVLSEESRILFYDILCSLANPDRLDTRGYSPLVKIAEVYAFSLLTGVTCGSPSIRGKTHFDTCPYISISAYHWYPQQINGHKFDGKNGDSIQLPENVLSVSPVNTTSDEGCRYLQFIEYSSQQWFLTGGQESALNNKILSVSLNVNTSYILADNNEVVYRINTASGRIVPRMSLCLLWNQASERWLSNGQLCRVVSDTSQYVECACTHMSSYAVYAHTDKLSSYNEAFFCAGFICISGFTLAILSQLFCTRSSMFAAKLLTHMMVACLGTQISFLASAYISPELSNESCAGLSSITHYFYLCQFVWMLIQAVNFWYVLVMNDEHADRRHLIFFVVGWGLPAAVVVLHLVILKSIYHKNITEIYGLVHGDMCSIPNVYAALFTAALVPLVCLVVVVVVFIHAYQVTQQWKAYDDVFRGRPNATEIPLILYLFAFISVTWLWGGLHMAYRHLWMLVLFIIFNSLQGLYAFVVYFIMHNQLCCPVKASYSIEMDGQRSPASAFFTPSSGMPPAGAEISKSTQNLISAMEEISSEWERSGTQEKQSPQNGAAYTPPGGYSNGSLVADEELQEFDDLIFVLKAGSGLNISDTESCHGSQDGGSMANSQIVELRRIPIADTHL